MVRNFVYSIKVLDNLLIDCNINNHTLQLWFAEKYLKLYNRLNVEGDERRQQKSPLDSSWQESYGNWNMHSL